MQSHQIGVSSWLAGPVLVAATLAILLAAPALASIETWNFTGILSGNSVNPDPILVDGAPGTTANLTAAGVAAGGTITGSFTYDTATGELLTFYPGEPDPDTGVYTSGGFNWTIGNLTARTAHANQAITYALSANIATPPDPPTFLDLIILGGGNPPAWTGSTYNLEVVTIPPDPTIPGDLGNAPTIILAMFEGTLVDNSQLLAPPGFILDKGMLITLDDTGTGQEIQLNIAISTITGGGTTPSCATFGNDTDGDAICDDVDNCVSTYNIGQGDEDQNGIGNECSGASDADGDYWEDGFDNCLNTPNGSGAGTCSDAVPAFLGASCMLHTDCGVAGFPGFCSRFQEDDNDDGVGDVCDPTYVPEPGQMMLLGAGLVGLLMLARRRARQTVVVRTS